MDLGGLLYLIPQLGQRRAQQRQELGEV